MILTMPLVSTIPDNPYRRGSLRAFPSSRVSVLARRIGDSAIEWRYRGCVMAGSDGCKGTPGVIEKYATY